MAVKGPGQGILTVLRIAMHWHRAIHERGFTLRWSPDGRQVQTLRPDGSVIEIREGRLVLVPQ